MVALAALVPTGAVPAVVALAALAPTGEVPAVAAVAALAPTVAVLAADCNSSRTRNPSELNNFLISGIIISSIFNALYSAAFASFTKSPNTVYSCLFCGSFSNLSAATFRSNAAFLAEYAAFKNSIDNITFRPIIMVCFTASES